MSASASERENNNNNTRYSNNSARFSAAASITHTSTRASITSIAPVSHFIPLHKDASRVTIAQASSLVCQSIGPQGDSPHLQTTTINSRINVSNTVTSHPGRALKQNSTNNSAFVTIDSLNAILDAKFSEWFNTFSPQPAGNESLLSIDSTKIVSMEG